MLGTLAMMLEASGAGARLLLDKVPVPEGVELDWWLKAYPSYGFLLSTPPENMAAVGEVLDGDQVEWTRIGEVTKGSKIAVEWEGETGLLLDWRRSPVTGLFKSQC